MPPRSGGDAGDGGGHRHVRHRRHRRNDVARRCGQLVDVADGNLMGWFNRTAAEDAMKGTLTADEKIVLSRLEATVQAGVTATLAVLEAGKALSEIRSRQLYRDTAATWDEYVTTRFKMTKRRADQLIAFAGVKASLEEMGTRVPEMSEKAARPLVGLSPETVNDIVQEAAGSLEGVTAGSIRKAAAKRRKASKVKVPRPIRFRVPGAVIEVAFNSKAAVNGFNVVDVLQAALDTARRQAAEAA